MSEETQRVQMNIEAKAKYVVTVDVPQHLLARVDAMSRREQDRFWDELGEQFTGDSRYWLEEEVDYVDCVDVPKTVTANYAEVAWDHIGNKFGLTYDE